MNCCNVNKMERIARVVIGVVACAWGYKTQNWWFGIGAIPLITGLAGFCPLYCVIKKDCNTENKSCCNK